MPAAQQGQRRRGRAQHLHPLARRRGQRQVARHALRRAGLLAADDQRRQPAEGRPVAGAALLGLGGQEPLQVVAQQGGHHRVLGAEGLQQDAPGRFRPPRAAGHLVQQLHGALARPQVAARQAQVGIHHADEREMREVPSLGDDLRADDQVHLARLDLARRLRRGRGAGDRVARHHQLARLGEEVVHLLLDALHAGADRHQGLLGAAFHAFRAHRLDMAAMVAG